MINDNKKNNNTMTGVILLVNVYYAADISVGRLQAVGFHLTWMRGCQQSSKSLKNRRLTLYIMFLML